MKKNLSVIVLLLALVSTACFAADETQSDAQTQQKVVDRVKEYCQLMQEVSGDVGKIDNMETIYGMCENSNVSVFNDLATASTKDISDNSMPLQQYMMMLTDKFENNVKTSFSGYKYLKTVVQPSPLKEFDAARYAFVKVDKQVNAPGIKTKQRLNIIVNTATMKVSSTISEDYEDPQRIYLEALELYNNKNYKKAIPLFEKVSVLQRFPGRFRAKTMLGWIYAEQKDYQKANKVLRESFGEDPLAGVILASEILLNDNAPVNLINYTEAGQILKKVGDARDKEIPTMHLIAKSAIVDAFDLQNTKLKIIQISDKLADELINDSLSTDAFKIRGYFLKAFNCLSSKDKGKAQTGLTYIQKAEECFKAAHLARKDFEHWDTQISIIHMNLCFKAGDQDKGESIMNDMMQKPYCAGYLANSIVTTTEFSTALEYYRKAADYGDPFATYVISISYLPTSKPLQDYEKDFIIETKNVKDEMLIKNWKKFVDFLISDKSQAKSYEEFLKWNQKAIDLGDINAIEDRAFFEAAGVPPCEARNIPHALKLACTAACVGLRSKSSKLFNVHGFTKVYEMVNLKIPFEETQTTKTLKALADEGNGAAAYLLFTDYWALVGDTTQAAKYLDISKDARFFYAMHTYAIFLLQNELYEDAEKMFIELTQYPNAYVCSYLGDIQKNHYKKYKAARQYYMLGYKEKDPICCERLADLYIEGLGCKKNPKLAKSYVRLSIQYYKELGYDETDDDIKRLRAKEAETDRLIAAEATSNSESGLASKLNSVLDASTSEDDRITISQSLLSEIFASPKAVVKTVGSNGKTIVSTETAEDFMLRLATMKTDKKMVEVSSKKDKNNKLTELTIQMK